MAAIDPDLAGLIDPITGKGLLTLGNGAEFVPPKYSSMPTWYSYANLPAQMHDALLNQGKGAGLFANNTSPAMQAVLNAPPTVGGGLLGATAYSNGPNPFINGWSPYAGRGNNAPPGSGPPGAPPGNPGAGQPPPPMIHPPHTPPGPIPITGPPPPGGVYGPPIPGTQPPPPPGSGNLPPRVDPITGQPIFGNPHPGGGNPTPNPFQTPGSGSHPGGGNIGPNPFQVPPVRVPGGLLGDPRSASPNQSVYMPQPLPTQGTPFVYPTPKYDISELKVPGAVQGQTDPQAMADFFMQLPEGQRADYFNAISQYGLTKGQNLGGALDAALRQTMGADAFKNWLTHMDTQQGSTIKSTAGLPDWLIKGLS